MLQLVIVTVSTRVVQVVVAEETPKMVYHCFLLVLLDPSEGKLTKWAKQRQKEGPNSEHAER